MYKKVKQNTKYEMWYLSIKHKLANVYNIGNQNSYGINFKKVVNVLIDVTFSLYIIYFTLDIRYCNFSASNHLQ